jgi:ribulose-phosphate 3-epimerase
MASTICISASVLSADPLHFGDQVRQALDGGAEYIHMDIMDGRFGPNITIGPFIVEALAPMVHAAGAKVEVHLMIEEPERFVPTFASAGADHIIIHVEGTKNLMGTLNGIRTHGANPGLTLRPKTPLLALQMGLPLVDLILMMSVEPGYSGQKFLPDCLPRIRRVRELLGSIGSNADVAVDGGVNAETAPQVVAAGANILVSGNAVFKAGQPIANAVRALRKAANGI